MNGNNFTNPLYFVVCSILGIYLTIYISKKIENINIISNYLEIVGTHTLEIMALHFISFKIVMFIQYKLGTISYNEIAYLTGANNNNMWYIIYIICGVNIPIILSKCKEYINKKILP